MKKRNFRLWLIFSLLWTAVILLHSAMPASASDAESLGLLGILQNIFPWLTNRILRKIGHFVEFAILGALLTCTYHNTKHFTLFQPLFSALFVSLCDETLQLYVPGRSGNLIDIWIDLSGAAFGIALMWLIYKLRKH